MNGEMLNVQMLLIFIVNVHSKLLNVKDLGIVKMSMMSLLNYYPNMMTIMMVLSILKITLNLLTYLCY